MAFLRDRSVFCIPEALLSYEERYIVGGICMLTASVGFTGAALQLRSLWQFRNRQRRQPSPNPDIIYYLALSDLIACTGVFALAICLMVLEVPTRVEKDGYNMYIPKHDTLYASIGTIIEVLLRMEYTDSGKIQVTTLFGYLASYIWTLSYALDMLFQIYRINCAMIVYHILAWAIPLELVAVIEAINFAKYPKSCEQSYSRLSRVLLSYTPVMIVMVANPVIFIITYNKVKQQLRSSGSFTAVDRAALFSCRRKFLGMVVVFAVCWLPNIFSVLYFLLTFEKHSDRKSKLDRFWYVEAFMNPLQGIFNYFLYRRAFRVTATDTRPEPNALPRVTRAPSLGSYRGSTIPSRLAANQTLQRITASTSSQDEETPLLRPQNDAPNPAPRYVYISRLLGE